jgi:GT2 family glycosyltransferase
MPEPCTIVIASYNRLAHLRDCLACLSRLDYPSFRVIVVDDGSPVPLAPLAEAFGDFVEVIRQDNKGPAAARNLGVEASSTDFVAFTDDDCRPEPDWLTHLERAYRAAPDALIGGRVVNGLPDNPFSAASQAITDFLYRWYAERDDRMRFFTTNNMAFSRRSFLKLGMLDPHFDFASEDRDLGLRWRAAGRPLVFCGEAVVKHHHALSLASFWRQHASYGRGARKLHLKLGGDPRLSLEPLAFYAGLLGEPFRSGSPGGLAARSARSLLIALSQAAMTYGYASERLRDRRRPAGARNVAVNEVGS